MRRCKSARLPLRSKWQENLGESQAMETLKRRVSELQDPSANVFSVLLDCFKKYEINPSPSAYSFIIKYALHKHLFSQIPAILDHLEHDAKLEVPERIFQSLIREYGKANMLQDAINLFFRIPKFKCTPSVVSLNSLLSLLCKRKEGLILVQDVLMKTPEMNIRLEASTFRILIRALCRNGKVGSVLNLLQIMELDEYGSDAKVYSMALSLLCRYAGGTEILSLLDKMKNMGYLPTVLEYNGVIDALIKEGRINHAHSLLEQMKTEGKRPGVLSYNSVLHGFCSANDFHTVEELFDEMLVTGLLPNIFTYNIYITSLCKQGKFERAHRMISCMDRIGCKPDTETFNILIAGYLKAGENGKSNSIREEMAEKGIRWNSNTYRILIDGHLHNSEPKEAYKLFMDMLVNRFTPQPLTCKSLVCRLCEAHNYSEAVQILEESVSMSVTPNAVMWEALLYKFILDFQRNPVDLVTIIEDS